MARRRFPLWSVAGIAGIALSLLLLLILRPDPTSAAIPLPISPAHATSGITLVKSAPATICQTFPRTLLPYTLTLQNPQSHTILASAWITDELPPGGVLDSGTTGPDWAGVLVNGSSVVTYQLQNDLSATASLVGHYNVALNPPFRDRSVITNSAYCFSGTVAGTPRAFCEMVPVTTVIRAPDFALAESATAPVCAGGRVSFTLTVTNPGGAGTSVPFTITGRITPALTVVPGTVSDGGAWTPPTVTWNVSTNLLPAGGNAVTRTFAVTVAPELPSGTWLTNTYWLASPEVLPNVPFWESSGLRVMRTAASFTTTTPVCHLTPVRFQNLSEGATGYAWNFGDGSAVSTEISPTHQYAAPGTYTVVLTATGPCGSDVVTGTVTVHPLPAPNLQIIPSPTQVGEPTAFMDSGTGGSLWHWNFGDGFTATTAVSVTTHVYTRTPGLVTVTLTSISGVGCYSTTSRPLVVNPGPPYTVSLSAPSQAPISTPVTVRAYVTDQWNNPVLDGTTITFTATPPLGVAPAAAPTAGGFAQTSVSSTVTGTARITATAPNGVSGTTVIAFTPGTFIYLPLVLREHPPGPFCAPRLVTTVATGPSPYGVAIDPTGQRAFVAHDQGVRVIDTVNHTVITDVRSLTAPHGIAYDPDRNRIWVTTRNEGPGHVRVLDGSTYAVLATLPAGGSPHSVAYNPTNGRVYVTNFLSDTVSVYNAATLTLTEVLTGFGEPAHIAVNPLTNKIYVANHRPFSSVIVISGTTHARQTIGTTNPDLVLLDAYGVAVDTQHNMIYATGISQGRIALIDGDRDEIGGALDIRRDGHGVWLRAIAVNPAVGDYGHVWVVTSSEDGERDQVLLIPVVLLGTPRVVPLDVAPYPLDGIALDPTTQRFWVTSVHSALVSVIQDGEPVCLTPFAAGQSYSIRRLP